MTKDESAVVEFFARRRGVFCNSLPTPEGHLVFLGGDLKGFGLYGEAMFYLSPSLLGVSGAKPDLRNQS
jgi:hypothetical protein